MDQGLNEVKIKQQNMYTLIIESELGASQSQVSIWLSFS